MRKGNAVPKVAALGYYGFKNLGDEAVLAGIRKGLQKKVGDIDLLVLSNDPAETERFHPGVRATDRWRWRDVAASLRSTDLFILGGGSLLQDATSIHSVLWYALMATLARRQARRVLWWGQGVGPLQSNVSRRLVRWIADQADAITVRDGGSAELLRNLGARKTVEIVADPAFALEPPPTTAGDQADPSVILALRPWRSDALTQSGASQGGFLGLIRSALPGRTLTALPMHLPGDRTFMENLATAADASSSLRIQDWGTNGAAVEQALGWVAAAEITVAMRLHALIFAARCGVPFVALSYDPKVDALARAGGQEDALVPVESFSQVEFVSALERVTQSAAARRERLRSFAAEQGRLALRPAEIATELLG